MKLTIIGTGYVGLVTGACFAAVGHNVICVDCDENKIKMLKSGKIPIYEPGLEDLVAENVEAGRLHFTNSTKEGVEKSDIIFIAVPTPPLPDGGVDLSFIEGVARDIAGCMTSYKIVVDKSTVPVKTGDKVSETIKRYCKAKVEVDVVSNPEFLREGSAVEDLMKPDRIVIGVRSQRPVQAMKEVYTPFNAPIIVTDINSAELIKHAANSFLALKISYINAISILCEASGANVQEVANGIGMDERIGRRFLDASLGFGGSCFPKDLSAFIKISEQLGYDFSLLKEVQRINAGQMERFVKKITDTLWVLKDKKIGVLGLAFKQNTDDVRMSPAIDLCHRLLKDGAILRVYDPQAMEKARP
ncbi:MAG: UDP-glucose/GDP-mannose dehydrogenase family protein, partial [Verrucomicrobiota bacterium]|nr:UDP-glucose/GDP-mannose dehydrogenase family protein [Verrucomicrobiota bacterium]